MKQMNKAIDEVRAGEARRLKQDGYEPVLKHSRWCLLKRPENLHRPKQTVKLAELLKYNLQSVRAYLHARGLPAVLGVQIARLGRQVPGRVVYARDAIADRADEESGPHAAETSAADPQLVPRQRHDFGRRRRGFQQQSETDHQKSVRLSHLRSRSKSALYHNLGDLPEPEFTHKFC